MFSFIWLLNYLFIKKNNNNVYIKNANTAYILFRNKMHLNVYYLHIY